MQYLSKAYNYYSGINPATLSGAIDVIVIRRVDAEGEITLQSSPFHVRFGKLQVLRAGEKRVTLRLPNNLPAPHVAPFSMKVGETGEAFFVLETTDDVPEELLTSPVVMPTENDVSVTTSTGIPPSPSELHSLTQQPFGETERLAGSDDLADVAYLDLNDTPHDADWRERADATSDRDPVPTSVLGSAKSMLPSIPFISSRSSTKVDEPLEPVSEPTEARHRRHKSHSPASRESFGSVENDALSRDTAGPPLPSETPSGELQATPTGEAPSIQYGNDVVLDMAGYHSEEQPDITSKAPSSSEVRTSVLDTFARDLLAAIPVDKRPTMTLRATDPNIRNIKADIEVATLVDDSPGDLDIREFRRSDRATSEPPVDPPDPISPKLDPSKTAIAMDYAWDWGRIRPDEHRDENHPVPDRRESLPPLDTETDTTAPNARLRNVEENPYLFVFDTGGRSHTFELSLSADPALVPDDSDRAIQSAFLDHRVTFQKFIESPEIVDDPRLVIRYSLQYSSWGSNYRLLHALAMYRRSLAPPSKGSDLLPSLDELGVEPPRNTGYAWSRWWRRSQMTIPGSAPAAPPTSSPPVSEAHIDEPAPTNTRYAKTLRLSSDQLKQLDLKVGPNTIQFSVSSSYSGLAVCSARIFLWEETDQIVISDIDGTITKSDALGHVYAAIGRDWTHLGIAKLYTDIANNGYRMLYLTSRAIGQADSTRGYLKSIVQGDYRLPEGPVIMSPDRLMASLHREVIMRKPELFKMACLRDILRLFPSGTQEAFYAGFGNRITDAMSYRSVGIPASKIYTIDSTGVVKTELLQAAGHKGSYIQLNDLVNEVFPPVSTKFKPEYTDFNYWRSSIPDVALPDLTPPSPALSARSDTSSRLSVLGKITGLGRRSSRQPILPTSEPSSRPSSPLIGPSFTSDDLSDPDSRQSSMPGSFEEDRGGHFPASMNSDRDLEQGELEEDENYDYDNEEDNFDDDLLATGEMRNVPF